jgi:hypothetical protein
MAVRNGGLSCCPQLSACVLRPNVLHDTFEAEFVSSEGLCKQVNVKHRVKFSVTVMAEKCSPCFCQRPVAEPTS